MVRCDEQEIDAQAHVHGKPPKTVALLIALLMTPQILGLLPPVGRGWSNSNRSRRHASDTSKSLDPGSSLYGISSTLLVTMIEPPATGHRLDLAEELEICPQWGEVLIRDKIFVAARPFHHAVMRCPRPIRAGFRGDVTRGRGFVLAPSDQNMTVKVSPLSVEATASVTIRFREENSKSP
jgi:hypothetical protein